MKSEPLVSIKFACSVCNKQIEHSKNFLFCGRCNHYTCKDCANKHKMKDRKWDNYIEGCFICNKQIPSDNVLLEITLKQLNKTREEIIEDWKLLQEL